MIEIIHIQRGFRFSANIIRHWAWLIKGNTFYSTFEYGKSGIVIGWYQRNNMVQALNNLMGDSKTIWYDRYENKIKYGKIWIVCSNMINDFNSLNYNILTNNCQHFCKALISKLGITYRGSNNLKSFRLTE